MRIVCISDTHELHSKLRLPEGDLLIHAGDITGRGDITALAKFMHWLVEQAANYQYGAVLIAGNHDLTLDPKIRPESYALALGIVTSSPLVHYLDDSGITLGGLNIWGSPVQPEFFDWAFNRTRGTRIRKHWDLIPSNTDILVTHGPPYGVLDMSNYKFEHAGCEELWVKVQAIKPKLHVFGHIHSHYGQQELLGTMYVNASAVNEEYKLVNEPIVVNL